MTEFLHAMLIVAFIAIVMFALLGAIDYIMGSVKIFIAFRRYRERNRREAADDRTLAQNR